MDKIKSYQEPQKEEQDVNEPIAAYGIARRNAKDYLEAVPQDIMQTLITFAVEDYEKGRCTSQSQMDSWVKGQMGWK